ncbi:reverse transcriptase domain-containing protein [Tanacetum coccineum]|uniref:Reverse transcriptase domain-containing protein n=1 Tax=Tanacetum coccineum TaxID=301880 RepID=A0ABQ5FIF5_9ASTR
MNTTYPLPLDTAYPVLCPIQRIHLKQINTAYPLPLDMVYRSSGTETEIFDFRAKLFLPSFGTNPADCLSPISEEAEAMAEIMEQYMSKTRTDYGSGVARPKIDNKDQFELKGQFLKELRENTFSGSDNEHGNEHIEKVLKIVDLFHVPKITVDQLMLRVFPISLTGAASHWLRNEPTGSIKTWEDLKTNFLNKYCPPGQTAKKIEEINNFQQEPDETLYQAWERFKELLMKGAVPTKTVADAKTAIQEMVEYSQKWHNGTFRGRSTETSDGLATIQAQLNNLGREIKKSRRTTVPFPSRLDDHYCDEKEGNYGPKFTEAYGVSLINNTIPQKEKDLGSFTLPCFINNTCFNNALVDLGASVSVMPLLTYLNLGLGELAYTRLTMELTDRTVKYPKGIAKNVLVGIDKFTFPVDFIILDMPEDIKVPLILGRPFLSTARAKIDVYKRKITLRVRSLDPFLGDYIELNDLNKPFELRRDQGDDLMPTIEEGEVIEEFSYCDDDKKIHIDCTHKLKFSCMIGFEFTHANFFPLLYVNMMSRKFHNSIMKNKMVYKGDNVVGALMNVPIFVGTFSVMTDFAVLEDIDAYCDDGMGDVIFGEPFLREVRIKTKQFEGIITLYNGDDEVSEKDERNGISHAYQKLKGFYKGVLNLGPNYIRDAKMEEWLTRGHISVHELE